MDLDFFQAVAIPQLGTPHASGGARGGNPLRREPDRQAELQQARVTPNPATHAIPT